MSYFIQSFSSHSPGVIIAALTLLLLPFAGVKIWPGVPLYIPETGVLILFLIAAVTHWRKFTLPPLLVLSVVLFGFSFFLSMMFVGWDAGVLGSVKSHSVFPLLFALLTTALTWREEDRILILAAWLLGITGVAIATILAGMSQWVTFDGRVALGYGSANFLAMALAPGIPLSLFLALKSAPRSRARIGTLIALLGIAIALFMTRSAGAMMGVLAATVPFYFWLTNTRERRILMLLLVGLACLGASLMLTKYHVVQGLGDRSSLASREMIWEASERILRDHWLLGVGIGKFQQTYLEYQKYFPPYLEWAVPQPHNLVLAMWMSLGAFGLLAFLILMGYFGSIFWKNKKEPLGTLGLSLLIYLFVHGLIDTPFFKNDLAFAWGVLVWIALVFSQSETGIRQNEAILKNIQA